MLYVFPVGKTGIVNPETGKEVMHPAKFRKEAIPYQDYERPGDEGLLRLTSEYSLSDLIHAEAAKELRLANAYDGRMRFFDAWSLLGVDITQVTVHLPSDALEVFGKIVGQPSVLITSLHISEFIKAIGNGQTVEISQVLTPLEGRRYNPDTS